MHCERDAISKALRRCLARRFCLFADVPVGAFRNLAPRPAAFSAMVPGMAYPTGAKSVYRAPALEWVSVKQSADKSWLRS